MSSAIFSGEFNYLIPILKKSITRKILLYRFANAMTTYLSSLNKSFNLLEFINQGDTYRYLMDKGIYEADYDNLIKIIDSTWKNLLNYTISSNNDRHFCSGIKNYDSTIAVNGYYEIHVWDLLYYSDRHTRFLLIEFLLGLDDKNLPVIANPRRNPMGYIMGLHNNNLHVIVEVIDSYDNKLITSLLLLRLIIEEYNVCVDVEQVINIFYINALLL